MSAERWRAGPRPGGLLTVLLAAACGAEAAGELPGMDFLEYLGSWEESDEEWIYFDTAEPGGNGEAAAPRQEDDRASMESSDED